MRYLLQCVVLLQAAAFALAQPQITAVVDSASFQPGLPAGGGLATLFCSGVVSVNPGTYLPTSSSPLPNQLAGFQISVNLAWAPILAVVVTTSGGTNYAQINFQVPIERNVSLRPAPDGFAGDLTACGAAPLNALPAQPAGSFFKDGNGYAVAQHSSDYSLVTPQNPAHPGETIIGYANGAFQFWPPPPIGLPPQTQPVYHLAGGPGSQYLGGLFDSGYLYLQYSPPYNPVLKGYPPNTLPLQIDFAGPAPGMVGVQQINFVIPASQQPGTFALFFDDGCPPGYLGSKGCANFPAAGPQVLLPVGN